MVHGIAHRMEFSRDDKCPTEMGGGPVASECEDDLEPPPVRSGRLGVALGGIQRFE